ncbi:MAG: hypothetical protein K9K64_06495 [Desulfohalobiaceae bacterium]|nr:hypothetical protein [Desulfohalobiaceae bacterium]
MVKLGGRQASGLARVKLRICFETTAPCGRLIIGTKAGTEDDYFLSARAMLPGRKAQPLSRRTNLAAFASAMAVFAMECRMAKKKPRPRSCPSQKSAFIVK